MNTSNCSTAVMTFLNWLTEDERVVHDQYRFGYWYRMEIIQIEKDSDTTKRFSITAVNIGGKQFRPLTFDVTVELVNDKINRYIVSNNRRIDLGDILEFMSRDIVFVVDYNKHHYFLKSKNLHLNLNRKQIKNIISSTLIGNLRNHYGRNETFNVVLFNNDGAVEIIEIIMLIINKNGADYGAVVITPQRNNWPYVMSFMSNPIGDVVIY